MRQFKNFLFVLIASIVVWHVMFFMFAPSDDDRAYLSAFDGAVDVELNVTGYVRHLRIKEGDTVQKEQVLMELEIPDIAEQVQQAKNEYEAIKAVYRRQLDLYRQNQITSSELDAAAENVKQAEKRHDDLQTFMSRNTMLSPIKGQVIKIRIKEGEHVEAGRSIMMIKP